MRVNNVGLCLFLGIALLGTVGCGGDIDGSGENVGATALPEIDVGTTNLSQSATTVASGWKGTISTNDVVEYWAVKTSYSAGAERIYSGGGTSQSCSDFKTAVCGAGYSGATYYKATVAEITLDCEERPGTISAPMGASSLLATGSYETIDSMSSAFAWTFVAGNVEYWAMYDLIPSSGSSTQAPLSPAYETLGDLLDEVCALEPAPEKWVTVYYAPVVDFCSEDVC